MTETENSSEYREIVKVNIIIPLWKYKTEEELKKLTLQEGMSESDRSIYILTKG